MNDRSCKTCRHWDAKPSEFTKTGRLKKNALGTCRYPLNSEMILPWVPYALAAWLRRELGRRDDCGMTGCHAGISCTTWAEKT
jgi:hypothetical protein